MYLLISLLLSLLTIVIATVLFLFFTDVYKWFYLPRGPLPLPFVGNKLSLPKAQAWLQFDKWAEEYGPIYTIWIGRTPTLIITNPSIAHDLLSTPNFSTRPRNVVFGELYMRMASIITIPYSKPWAVRRMLFHQSLKMPTIQLYKPRQEAEASLLSRDLLLDGGENWVKAVDRYTAGVIMTTAYGRRIESMNAEVITRKLGFLRFGGSLMAPGRFWVESWPWLLRVPGMLSSWKKDIERKGNAEAAFNIELMNLVRADMKKAATDTKCHEAKEHVPSFIEQVLTMQSKQESQHLQLDTRSLAALGGTFFTAGFDTTASTFGSCLLALILHPLILQRAQSELDDHLPWISSRSRSPTFADKDFLPYIYAIVLETLRWRPAVPLGLAHASTRSCAYGGYTIPAGTTVIASAWSLNHDPAICPSPSIFDPARFLPREHPLYDPSLVGAEHPLKSRLSSFGWGRRACPGEQLAINTLFIGLAKLLWGFRIKGVQGEKVDALDYEGAGLVRPKAFGVRFVERSVVHREVLEREGREAEVFMRAFERVE